MIPILFRSTETAFTSNGIGRLSDAISCEVTEERNGKYELQMDYPVTGAHYSDVALGNMIFVKPARYSTKQAFEIYEISKPINGKVTVNARHISYRLSNVPCMPFSATDVAGALSGLKSNAAESCPFTFWTNKATLGTYTQKVPASIRSRLGGTDGSILDVYGGGDYEWDMYTVKLWSRRGLDKGVTIRYGKNLTDLKQEESIEDTITGIVPYYSSENTTVTLPEKAIETEYAANYAYPRTIPLDLTSEFENEAPTVAQLRAAGAAYISSHNIGVPKVNLTVSFVNLADTEEYKDIAVLEDVSLCDTVTVLFDKLGVNSTARVIKTVYNVLTGRYKTIELGDAKATLPGRIAEQERQISETPSVIQSAVEHATNLITGELGGYVVLHTNAQGKPYEILIMDTEDINTAVNVWRWNQAGWGHSSTGYNGPYTLAATLDGGIVADYITSGTITGIRFNNGNGTFLVDASGRLTATSATITGVITATSGTFTGTINAQGGTFSGNIQASGTISGGAISGASISGGTVSGASISGGTLSIGSLFGVTNSGKLTATDANLYGTISFVSGGSNMTHKYLRMINGNKVILDPGFELSGESLGYGITVSNSAGWASFIQPGAYYIYKPGASQPGLTIDGDNIYTTNLHTSYIDNIADVRSNSFTATGVNGTVSASGVIHSDDSVSAPNGYFNNLKSRVVDTKDYNTRLLYCLEAPSPMFSDFGEGRIDESGTCYVFIDDIFSETVERNVQYQVQLQKYGDGDCWVEERNPTFFIVKGTADLDFGWSVHFIQRDFDTLRLGEFDKNNISGRIVDPVDIENISIADEVDLNDVTNYIAALVRTEVDDE